MQTDTFINQIKQQYQKTKPISNVNESWDKLSNKLVDNKIIFPHLRKLWFYVLLIILFLGSGGLVIASQFSKPGEILYSLRQISTPIITALGVQPQQTTTPKPASIKDQIKSERLEASKSGEKKGEENKEINDEDNNIEIDGNGNDLLPIKEEEAKLPKQNNQEINKEFQQRDEKEEKTSEHKKEENNKKWYEWILEQHKD